MLKIKFVIVAVNVLLTLGVLLPAVHAQEILSLEQALEIAMENSPDMQQVRLNLERSQERLKAQKAALKSRFFLQLTPYEYNKDRRFNTLFSLWNTEELKSSSGLFAIEQPIKWTDGTLQLINRFSWQEASSEFRQTERERSFNNNLYLSFEQPIFTYNRTKLDFKEVELDLENAALNYAIQKLFIEKSVNQSFYDLYYKQESLVISKEEEKNNQESYEIIKKKVEAGISAKEELYQAELNLADSRSMVQNAQVELDNALDEFKNLLGISLFKTIQVLANIQHQEVSVDLDKATQNGLKQRMELRQREINLENSMDDLTRTSALNEFKGNISLSYGIIGTHENFEHLYDDPTQNQKYSISFEIPLWDWGEKKARIKAQEASIKQSELNYHQTENDIIIEIRRAYRELKNQILQIETRRTNVQNAQLTYDLNLERYKNGDLTSKLLGDYQTQLSRQKLGFIQAQIQYRLALLDLKIQSLWDFEKDASVIQE